MSEAEAIIKMQCVVESAREQTGIEKGGIVYHQSDTGKLHKGRDIYTGDIIGIHFGIRPLPKGFYGKKQIKAYLKSGLTFFNATSPNELKALNRWFLDKEGIDVDILSIKPGMPDADPKGFSETVLTYAKNNKYDGIQWGENDFVVFDEVNITEKE